MPTNMFRIALHPQGFALRTINRAAWTSYLLRELDLAAEFHSDVAPLAHEVASWPGIPDRANWRDLALDCDEPVMTWRVQFGQHELALYTIMSRFGTPNDVTLSELTIELFYPADKVTADHLRRLHAEDVSIV